MSRGAKPGERRGGRTKGTPNKKNQEMIQSVEESGLTPLEYLLSVMRDDNQDEATRRDAAKAAAPYIHPKLSASTIDANVNIDHESALDELEGEED